jgi:cytochrome d ubiquinol oxidase subunit II
MNLNTIWFILISVLFTGFFFLEGFDYGVGILLPFLGRNDSDRRVIINTIGPFWDGNEVWLITAGGAMFAAFPHWYATMFSGFYLALFLILVALIGRGVAFEFRSKDKNPAWRTLWDWVIFVGSLVPALLWGVAFGNLIRGVPIDATMRYVGSFWTLLNPYALAGGLATLSIFTLHGAIFLSLKTRGAVMEKAYATAKLLWLPTVVLVFLFLGAGYYATDIYTSRGVGPGVVSLGAGVALLLASGFIGRRYNGWAFTMTGMTIVFSAMTVAVGLYPRLMVSSLNPDWSLTIYNASSSPYTLKVMTIIALVFVPIVLLYQGWSYWVFRERIGSDRPLEY